jgi:hypothetical protein
MQLLTTLLTLLLTSTLSSALPVTKTKRSVSTVLSDLASISSDVATLTSDATAYTGGLFQSLALAITVDSLESAITTATSDTTSSGTFSSTDSDSILAAVTTLTPNIVTLLSDLDAKVILPPQLKILLKLEQRWLTVLIRLPSSPQPATPQPSPAPSQH